MAVTGQLLLGFLLGHALGNATFWRGGINAYAARLHALPAAVWAVRFGLFGLVVLHAWQGVVLTLENRSADGGGYAVTTYRRSTFAARTMIWTGLALTGFLVFHLLHLTLQVIHPGAAAQAHADPAGLPDVQRMLVAGFSRGATTVVYLAGMVALGLHLLHGAPSSVQTLGLNGPRSFPWLERAGAALALLLAGAFAAIPAGVLAGLAR